jgi:hypothetical protein
MEEGQWQLAIIDGSVYKDDREALQQHIQHCINKPFNLSQDYMLRAEVIAIDKMEHILVITMHHIASDGWSLSIIVKEVVELYNSCIEGRAANLLPMSIQYADYAIWQRNYVKGEVLESKLNYWKEKLEGVAPLLLPLDYERPAVQSKKGAVARFSIDKI